MVLFLSGDTSAMRLGGNFWFWDTWSPEKPFKEGVNFGTTTDPWNPVFMDEVKIYSLLRFMENNRTNNSGVSDWSERRQKTNPVQEGGWADANGGPGIAYEWMIDLCNRIKCDMWTCIPHLSIAPALGTNPCDYALRLCILAKTGVDMRTVPLQDKFNKLSTMTAQDFITAGGVKTCEPLAPGLKLYLEYSNELWHEGFAQGRYAGTMGQQMNLSTSRDAARHRFTAWASVRIYQAMDLVYGKDSKNGIKIASVSGLSLGEQIKIFNDTINYNKTGSMPTALSVVTYFNGSSIDQLKQAAATSYSPANMANFRRAADAYHAQLISYEGGPSCDKSLNSNPGMFDVVTTFCNTVAQSLDVLAFYCHCSANEYGAKTNTGQPISEAHKYRALVQWATAHPVSTIGQTAPLRLYVPRQHEGLYPAVTLTGQVFGRTSEGSTLKLLHSHAAGFLVTGDRSVPVRVLRFDK